MFQEHKNSKQPPVILGPMFLSWNGNETSYDRFFLMKTKCCDRSAILIGSDQEFGLVDAINEYFPEAMHILVYKQLKDNTRHNISRSLLDSELNKLRNGLIFSEILNAFNDLASEIMGYHNIPYTQRLIDLWEKVYLPHIKNKNIPNRWTNNNNKSYNRTINQEIYWTALPLHGLIEKLEGLAYNQADDLISCLHGRGSFELSGQAEDLLISQPTWIELNQDKKERRFQKLLSFTHKSLTSVTSTDGSLTVAIANRIAKKKI